MFIDFGTGGLTGSKGAGPDDIPAPNGRKTTFMGKGYEDNVVDDIFNMRNVDSCSDELLDSILRAYFFKNFKMLHVLIEREKL